MFDRDGDGKISAAELGHAFRVQGQNFSDAEIRQIIKEIDEDGKLKLTLINSPSNILTVILMVTYLTVLDLEGALFAKRCG